MAKLRFPIVWELDLPYERGRGSLKVTSAEVSFQVSFRATTIQIVLTSTVFAWQIAFVQQITGTPNTEHYDSLS